MQLHKAAALQSEPASVIQRKVHPSATRLRAEHAGARLVRTSLSHTSAPHILQMGMGMGDVEEEENEEIRTDQTG